MTEVGDLTNLALYYCSTGITSCTQTTGYIKTSDSKYYAILKTGTNVEIISTDLVDTCTTPATDFGKLYTGNLLCIADGQTVGFDSPGQYEFKENNICNSNAFTSSASAVDEVIHITSNAMVVNPYYESKYF